MPFTSTQLITHSTQCNSAIHKKPEFLYLSSADVLAVRLLVFNTDNIGTRQKMLKICLDTSESPLGE